MPHRGPHYSDTCAGKWPRVFKSYFGVGRFEYDLNNHREFYRFFFSVHYEYVQSFDEAVTGLNMLNCKRLLLSSCSSESLDGPALPRFVPNGCADVVVVAPFTPI